MTSGATSGAEVIAGRRRHWTRGRRGQVTAAPERLMAAASVPRYEGDHEQRCSSTSAGGPSTSTDQRLHGDQTVTQPGATRHVVLDDQHRRASVVPDASRSSGPKRLGLTLGDTGGRLVEKHQQRVLSQQAAELGDDAAGAGRQHRRGGGRSGPGRSIRVNSFVHPVIVSSSARYDAGIRVASATIDRLPCVRTPRRGLGHRQRQGTGGPPGRFGPMPLPGPRSDGFPAVTSTPRKMIAPPLSSSSMRWKPSGHQELVLPAPFWPIRPTISPR